MGNQLLSSKVIVQEEEPKLGRIPTLATAVAGFVGVTERGPIGVAIKITSFDEFLDIFGGFLSTQDMPLSIFHFFNNGGEVAWIVRTCHYTDITSASAFTATKATKSVLQTTGGTTTKASVTGSASAPFGLIAGGTIVVHDESGLDGTATFTATKAVVTGAGGAFAAMNNETMGVQVEGGGVQTVTFGTEATIDAAIVTMNAQLAGCSAQKVDANNVKIVSDMAGSDSRIRTSSVAAGIVTKLGIPNNADSDTGAPHTAGAGNVADIANVTIAEAVSIIDAALVDITATAVGNQVKLERDVAGLTKTLQVQASSTVEDLIGFATTVFAGTDATALNSLKLDGKTEGTYAAGLDGVVAAATDANAEHFNLSIVRRSDFKILEVFPNLTMDSTKANYVETVVNHVDTGSNLVAAVDLEIAGTATARRPVNGTHQIAGGDDGLGSLADTDFVGAAAGFTGLRALDLALDLTLLAVPGETSETVWKAILDYCDVTRSRTVYAVLDPPTATSAASMASLMTTRTMINYSEMGMVVWPNIEVANPATRIYGTNVKTVALPPSALVLGMFSRTDNARPGGIYNPPTGIEDGKLLGAVALEKTNAGVVESVLEEKRDLVYPQLVNPIHNDGGPIHLDGVRTCKEIGDFPTVAERRGVSFIGKSIKGGLAFAKGKNNDRKLRQRVFRTIRKFLKDQMKVDAFASQDPKTAFFVDVSDKLNSPSVVRSRQLQVRVGLATQSPAEFIVISISQDLRALEEEEQAAA